MTSSFTARAIAALFSEEKSVCVRIPPFPASVSKAQTSAKEKYGFSLIHTQRCRANPHAPIKMAMRSRVIVCGDWLVCQTISVRKDPARILARV